MDAPKATLPEEEEQIEDIPLTMEQQLHAIDERLQELETELESHRQQRQVILPELERMKKNLAKAGQDETRQAVAEQLSKFKGESAKKLLDRVLQTKLRDQKFEYLQANVAKCEAALWVHDNQMVEIKGKLTALKKQRGDLLAGHYLKDVQQTCQDFGRAYVALEEVFQKFCKAINLYRAVESDLPARLRSMGIRDPFMIELWGLLGSRDLEGKLLDVINGMASRWSIPDNPFVSDLKTIADRPDQHHFGLERPFGHAPMQR